MHFIPLLNGNRLPNVSAGYPSPQNCMPLLLTSGTVRIQVVALHNTIINGIEFYFASTSMVPGLFEKWQLTHREVGGGGGKGDAGPSSSSSTEIVFVPISR